VSRWRSFFKNHCTVCLNPLARSVSDCQPRSLRAFEVSEKFLLTSPVRDSECSILVVSALVAIWKISPHGEGLSNEGWEVRGNGLGGKGLTDKSIARTRSSMYMKSRVCPPSPRERGDVGTLSLIAQRIPQPLIFVKYFPPPALHTVTHCIF